MARVLRAAWGVRWLARPRADSPVRPWAAPPRLSNHPGVTVVHVTIHGANALFDLYRTIITKIYREKQPKIFLTNIDMSCQISAPIV